MRFIDYLDKGASLGAAAPCLTMDGRDLSYGEVQRLSYRFARGLARSGIAAGEKVAILSGNDPVAFACVFGISRAGSVWCPINPRNEAAENRIIGEVRFQARIQPEGALCAPRLSQFGQGHAGVTLDGDDAGAIPDGLV